MKGTVKRTWNLPLELAETLDLEAKRRRTTVTSVLHGILGVDSLSAGVWYIAIDFQLFALTALLL